MPSNLRRGSTWAKWDMHVHTPCSALNNNFPKLPSGEPDWEAYISALEKLDGYAALAVADYFEIEGYKRILEYRAKGRLKNIPLILPNIEFRIDKFVGTQGGEKQRRINLHVVFSDQVQPDDIEEHFLRNLSFTCEAYPQGPDEKWRISRPQLSKLGERLIDGNTEFAGMQPFVAGCTNAAISVPEMKQVLDSQPSLFLGKYLVILAEDSLSDLKWGGQDHQVRRVLLQGTDAIFSANPKTRAWTLGEADIKPDDFRREYRSLKPCVHGTDAHSLESIGKPALNRFCWIKGEPTFEGLKQIFCEPKDRVHIGETAPNLKHDYQVLTAVQVTGAGTWFPADPIPLSADLVSVIGGRGSGKSALAELTAYAGGSTTFKAQPDPKTQPDLKDTFLQKASRKTHINTEPITGAKVKLTWANGQIDEVEIKSGIHHELPEEKVKYLPQSFVEHLCDPEHTVEIEREIERVIFQRIEQKARMGASNFRELRERATEAITLEMAKVRKDVTEFNRRIFDLAGRIGLKPEKQKELDLKQAEIATLEQKPPEVPPENDADLKLLKELNDRKREFEQRGGEKQAQLSKIDALRTKIRLFGQEVAAYNADIANILVDVGLTDRAAAFEVRLPAEADAIVNGREQQLRAELAQIEKGNDGEVGPAGIEQLRVQIKAIEDRLTLSGSRRAEFEKYQRECDILRSTIASLKSEIAEIEAVLLPALEKEQEDRTGRFLDYFELLRDEQKALAGLYAPLHTALQQGGEIDKKLTFVSRVAADIQHHHRRGMDIIDRSRKGRYRGEETLLERALREFYTQMEEGDFQRDKVKEQITALYDSFCQDADGKPLRIADQLRKGKVGRDFDDWLYSTDYFSVTYAIRFDEKNLEVLSPGQKGIVLLLLYLEIEREDNRPLIIDQPEENLDNLSVYENLIEYFRNRKRTRQIIVITHNPNLVVNTDSEQVIVAQFDGARSPKIAYVAGALEDTNRDAATPGIREQVCKILEGGQEAFRRREERYSLPRS
jgi:hypothetical protein